MLHRCFVGFLILSLSLIVGCSSKNMTSGRVPVSGSVSIKGEPLSEGLIQFEPLEKQNTSASVVLIGGNFSISSTNGLQPGMYLVRITAGDAEEDKPVPGKALTSSGDKKPGSKKKPAVPPEWGEKSKQQVEVKAEGLNKFDFEIK